MTDEPAPAPQDAVAEQAPAAARGMGEQTIQDYWFDLSQDDGTGQKTCVTYAYGLEIDRRSDDPAGGAAKSFSDLMAEALPAIQADIDAYGIAP